jgi:hypothetical protein
MIVTLTSIENKTTKVKTLRENGFCVFFFSFVWVLFCGGSLIYIYIFVKLKKFYISKNLVIIFKLNAIESFYQREKKILPKSWFFLVLIIVLKK